MTHYTHAPERGYTHDLLCYAAAWPSYCIILLSGEHGFSGYSIAPCATTHGSEWVCQSVRLSPVLHAPFCFLFGALFVCQLVCMQPERQTST